MTVTTRPWKYEPYSDLYDTSSWCSMPGADLEVRHGPIGEGQRALAVHAHTSEHKKGEKTHDARTGQRR